MAFGNGNAEVTPQEMACEFWVLTAFMPNPATARAVNSGVDIVDTVTGETLGFAEFSDAADAITCVREFNRMSSTDIL